MIKRRENVLKGIGLDLKRWEGELVELGNEVRAELRRKLFPLSTSLGSSDREEARYLDGRAHDFIAGVAATDNVAALRDELDEARSLKAVEYYSRLVSWVRVLYHPTDPKRALEVRELVAQYEAALGVREYELAVKQIDAVLGTVRGNLRVYDHEPELLKKAANIADYERRAALLNGEPVA
jgi:hypothetical protein